MIIISHRGFWLDPSEKNSEQAFIRSYEGGFGVETDVRDHDGALVISHDPSNRSSMPFGDFLKRWGFLNAPLALNIKADGLAKLVKEQMAGCAADWFVFDMSIPDMRAHINAGNPVFARISDVEKGIPWEEDVAGVWLDSFGPEWYGAEEVHHWLGRGYRVCIVSPELHGRPHEPCWLELTRVQDAPGLFLCTDYPSLAYSYFNPKQESVTDDH